MTEKTFKKAECLRNKIHTVQCYLKYIKHYENKLFDYNIKISLPHILGTFAVNDDLSFCDKKLKKDLLNIIKIYLVKEIQDSEKELEQL